MTTQPQPLISCIMPTTGARRGFIDAAVNSFLAQDYARRELIIVDEPGIRWRSEPSPWYARHEQVSVLSLFGDVPLAIGAKRNLALSAAAGQIICHWDDDDEYAGDRLSRQAAPIISGEAEITGMPLELVRDAVAGRTWRCSARLADALFACGVHGGTLMYRRALWCETAAFANVSSGEDGGFLRLLLSRGARLSCVPNNGSFVYVRHDPRNLWPLDEAMDEREWERVA